ncbi:aminopeptidase [Cuneatibacter sp. NSJ-177]|uniref:aminopeptidase n=1 Tax=Cuneatibacter sp. NSJ-177 TaxID=2931401 RepID=UPI001FD208C7|nr:aminopeptidase [Cuneatibacter sp. NSJ-177]MCJ7837506.1 aminopeptidase [Cuneatibacter sp. NSJ-177]
MNQKTTAWHTYQEKNWQELEQLSESYRRYLDAGKTERECIAESIRLAEEAGFRPLGPGAGPGDRVYVQYMGKTAAFFHLGTEPLAQGLNILGAHVDSPRLDVKGNPLYEDGGLAYLDLHYYGGIKKYQWTAIPMALHGVVIKKDGTSFSLSVGEEDSDPVFTITDLLPHLAAKQAEKKADVVVEGEALDLLAGTIPVSDCEKDVVCAAIMRILKDTYGMEADDFLSAELEVVPAGRSREAGFDRSMLLAYGHDDRSCAYTSLHALFQTESPRRTSCCFLSDKEEIGSVGASGAQSNFFPLAVAELLKSAGEFSEWNLLFCLRNSVMLSADVTAAYDPLYADVYEKRTAAYLGRGVAFCKYTGSRGKSGANDAEPELIAQLRRILDQADVSYQFTELGRVDAGGGGTIAMYFSRYGMQVIDCGIPVLSMHAPWELISKADLYEAHRCFLSFLKDAVPIGSIRRYLNV